MRAFFAVDLPDSLAPAVAEAQAPFADASGVNPVDPEQAHVTLKFLGDIGTEDDEGDPALDDVAAAGERAVDRAAVSPFEAEIRGLGVFPNREYGSVVWAGVGRGGDDLAALYEALEAETTALGVDPKAHAFTPHVTLARVESATGAEAVRDALDAGDPEVGTFSVDEIRLVKSALTASGPEYGVVRGFGLE
ncbi:RNA 2',3'-cyclic phosphodiesterase [Halorubrum ezzemoulense]|uniref:RNA 2',3'-cyclic phosphodiesterase n=1 Tax=Halorubrum ezzemoulense TaxID=337243 RepID=UPI0023312257|nr:RNA 2',3'-cyclic phosphodiesterase [Halorubrum ezzemoulense]MDB2264910.1 RNA 2',3'-cyclic phosphodiesterase [Halorubrum ezzemoulense]MDB2274224.1 RNA 2',3'-cyclic phosphodiesterase [Halorubrum ezzemoulense]MDB9301812.1 RNA 2',3'-cyclic phosphodiesterase [Halorubrum ezzemoulense]